MKNPVCRDGLACRSCMTFFMDAVPLKQMTMVPAFHAMMTCTASPALSTEHHDTDKLWQSIILGMQ